MICNPSTIEIDWLQLRSDFALSCRGHYNWWKCNDNWWWLSVFANKEAKSGRSSGAVPKIRRQSIHSDTMPQIKDNSRWLSQGWGILAIVTQFGQIVSTSADRLILNQNKTLLWIAAKNKVLTADKIATAEDGLGKVFCNPVNCGRIAEST